MPTIAYIILYTATLFAAFGDIFIELKRHRLTLYYFAGMLMLMFASLRWQVGYDWGNYHQYYNDLAGGEFYWFEGFNWGYSLLSYSLAVFNSYSVFLFFISLIMFMLISKFIYHFSDSRVYSFFIYLSFYFLPLGLGQLRQGLAVSILAYSCIFLHKRKLIIFALLIAVATSFHFSSIVFAILYYVYHRLGVNKLAIILLSCLTLVFGQFDFVRDIYIDLYGRIPFDNAIFRQFFAYTGLEVGESTTHYLGLIERVAVLAVVIGMFGKLKNEGKTRLLTISYVIAVNVYFLFFNIAIFAGRFGVVFKFVDIALLPLLVKSLNVRSELRFLLYIILAVYAILRAYMIIIDPAYINYKFFL